MLDGAAAPPSVPAGMPAPAEAPSLQPETRRVILSGGLLGGGGVQTHLSLLAKLLRKSGCDVVLLGSGSQWPADVLDDVRAAGVRVVLPPAGLAGGLPGKLATLLNVQLRLSRSGNPTVYCIGEGRVHAHVVRRAGAVRGSRSAYAVYHEIIDARNPGETTTRAPAPVDAYVANSEPVAAEMRSLEPAVPVRVIPFLTSLSPTPAPAPRPPLNGRPVRVTFLGRLAEHKRPQVLVREWLTLTCGNAGAAAAGAAMAGAELDVYGYGELFDELRAAAAAPALGGRVRVHGRYPNSQLPQILENADIVVLPSTFEGLPLVLVEAMLAGVPIVASDAGGVREFDDPANPGAIVTTTDWNDFARGLGEMARRVQAGAIDAVRLHRHIDARYGFDAVSRLWLDALTSPRAFFGGNASSSQGARPTVAG
jgi:glycosyltransferase involved in cell wall biosynthesis